MADHALTLTDEAERTAADDTLAYVDTRARALLGVRLMLIRHAAILGMSAVGSTYLIRRIGPATWGGFATSYMLLVALDNLLSHSLIAGLLRRDVPAEPSLVASAARLCLIAGVGLGALLAVAPVLIAPLYAPPHLGLLFGATAVCVVFYAGRSLPLTLLERELSYRVVATSEIADMSAFYIIAVPLVAVGAGAWGLAAATLCRGIVTFGIVRLRESAPLLGRPARQAIRVLLPFGLPLCAVIGVGILDALVPVVLIGRHPVQLAFLVVASTLLGYAVAASLVIQRVAIPGFARLRAGEFDTAVTRAAVLAGVLTAAAMLIALASAPFWLVPLLGPKWSGGVETLQLVALGFIASGPIGIYGSALTARGESRPVLYAQLGALAAYAAVGVVLVAAIGPNGAAAAFAASRWLWALQLIVVCRRRLGLMPPRELIVSLTAALAVGVLLTAVPHHTWASVALAVLTILGWLVLCRRELIATMQLMKNVATSRRSSPPVPTPGPAPSDTSEPTPTT
jgi:PST family polysaccharide transporter